MHIHAPKLILWLIIEGLLIAAGAMAGLLDASDQRAAAPACTRCRVFEVSKGCRCMQSHTVSKTAPLHRCSRGSGSAQDTSRRHGKRGRLQAGDLPL